MMTSVRMAPQKTVFLKGEGLSKQSANLVDINLLTSLHCVRLAIVYRQFMSDLLFNITSNAVGLHHSGGLTRTNTESFNNSTQIATIIARSRLVRRAADANKKTGKVKVTKGSEKKPDGDFDSKGIDKLLTE